jgi:Caenorhabditis protein of unknown function, DUF268.
MKKVLVWGTGNIAKHIISNNLEAKIIGFIQTEKSVETFNGKKVYTVEELPEEYDFIIVANSFTNEIFRTCQLKNISLDKVLFLKNLKVRKGLTDLNIIRDLLGYRNFMEYCAEFDLKEYSFFEDDKQKYNELNKRDTFKILEKYLYPIICDKYSVAGSIGSYFFQDLWAAKKIIESGIKMHFDIGSRIDGFIAHLLAVGIDVTMIDVREFPNKVDHLHTILDDATTLRQIQDDSIESMSALCSLEHFGLGRYGDPINPEGCFECFNNIQKKLKKGGKLYISVPIGMERVEFNAHRIFYPSTIIESFSSLSLKEFSCVTQDKIEYNMDIHKYDNEHYSRGNIFGLFYFIKQ